jgi:regulator of nonsense transcripts 2
MIEEKLKNIRFIGELVKFRITPNLMVFHFIKLLLEDFNFDNIEIFCALLESCGRFLYCTTETHATLVHFIEILGRKKVAGNFDTKYVFMIENAIYVCNPPSASVGTVKVREPIELFLRKLKKKQY